jgi:hypothetical protein
MKPHWLRTKDVIMYCLARATAQLRVYWHISMWQWNDDQQGKLRILKQNLLIFYFDHDESYKKSPRTEPTTLVMTSQCLSYSAAYVFLCFISGLLTFCTTVKIKVISLGGPLGCVTSMISHYLDNWLTDGGEVVSLIC